MNKIYFIAGALLVISCISIVAINTKTENINSSHKKIVKNNNYEIENTLLKKSSNSVSKDINFSKVDFVLSNKLDNDQFKNDNSIEKLKSFLSFGDMEKQTLEKLVTSVSLLNTQESVEVLLDALIQSIKNENVDNLYLYESAFANFDNIDVTKKLASFLYKSDVEIPVNIQYAIEKCIQKTTDRDLVASYLTSLYQSLDEDNKEKMVSLDYPEMYASVALDSYKNGDLETYENMVRNLSKSTKKEVFDGFMTLARKSEEGLIDDISKVALQWSSENSSQSILEIAEDYLSNGLSTPKERMVASSILSSSQKEEQILNKFVEYENDGDVISFTYEQLEKTKE